MKSKIILFLLSVSFISSLSAQSLRKKKKNKWGCAIAINSIQAQVEIPLVANSGEMIIDGDGNIVLKGARTDHSISLSILPKYYINDDFLLRFEFGITNLKLKSHFEADDATAPYHEKDDDEVTTKIYRFAPGFQWFFFKTKKIESYGGMTVSYIHYNSSNYHYYHEKRNSITGELQGSNDVSKITPGGFAAGAGAFAGFNIYLFKRISLGAEFSSSALYYKLGGEATQSYTEFNIGGPNPAVTYYSTYPNSYKGFKISKITSSFYISFWF